MRCEEASIIVVDDVNAMRVQIRDLLRRFGFANIKIAAGVEEAKSLMEMEQFHLVLSDWHMTPTTGLDLLQYLRSHPEYKNVPFILVTAECTKDKVIEAVKAGVDDFIVKPITPLQIQTKVINLLVKKQVAE